MSKTLFQIIGEKQRKQEPFAVATVVKTHGSASARASSKAIINADGTLVAGWVGGGCAESTTCEQAVECIENGQTAILDIDLDDEMLGAGMPCGGGMKVYIEPVLPQPTLWIMGHGRVAEVLCLMADLLGLHVIVNDTGAHRDKFPHASDIINGDFDYSSLKPAQSDYVVIATQHKGDHESIAKALHSDANYIALIASQKRATLVLEYLREEGFSSADLERVTAPCGIDLGATTPEEIALCIISEITLLRRNGTGKRRHDLIKTANSQINTGLDSPSE
ncbi:XdhC family protein [Ningiella sp. W23]|uniref:XdhC family protein n=1 Tax=Ningiella sp. W23 TaxID=3023715 RepID=UPI0037582572